ncbi:MAG: DUF349 domain-containing protein [Burkholderiaceae bacterium]
MLDWIFKKDKPAAAAPPSAAARPAPAAAAAAPAIDWPLKLQAASGDDTALLALLRESAPVDVKMAAVAALGSEAALKVAEREHRDHDRRVHRLAKQRHLAQVALRETAEQAGRLINAARALLGEPVIPSNRLVELGRAWQSLNLALLEVAHRAEFESLLAQLGALTRERGDEVLKIERWSAEARDLLARWQATCAAAAAGTESRSALATAANSARAVLEAAPAADACAALKLALQGTLQTGAELDERLAVLDALLQAPSPKQPLPPAEPASAEADLATPADPVSLWSQFPPLADARLEAALKQRHGQWLQALDDAKQARRTERRERTLDRERGVRIEKGESLATALERAESALAAGHLADTHRHLIEIDELLHAGAQATPQRARIDALQAEYTRLKGWQHWGGGLARDDLVLQAEALATLAPGEPGPGGVKLSIRQRSELIDELRARWKELDRLGGATNRALWQRFEAALKSAHAPVAAQLDVQRAARQQNLLARDQLVDTLSAVALPGAEPGAAAPDWKLLSAALDRFHTEWRKLGPLEHTVPHKQRGALLERMVAAVARLEVPLNDARRTAEQTRERLIARAQSLVPEAGAGPQARELVGKVRELQADWQQHAATLPLARAAENALWGRFKAAIDAVFAARDAVFNAREAEFQAHGAERAALIARLAALPADAAPAELKRTLAEVDTQWQRAGPAPRSDAAALDAGFRSARDAAQRQLASHGQRSWQAVCDAVLAKLALCESLEDETGAAPTRATLEQAWAGHAALPVAWEQALAERASLASAAKSGPAPVAASSDELLLQLEAAFQLESPPAFQDARRALKLQAMKVALEGRPSAAAQAALTPEQWLATALGRAALEESQRQRLRQVVTALRERGPIKPA